MQAPVELHSKIVEFFTSIPNIDVSDSRRAFVYSVSLDPQLQDLIDFAGPSAQFLQLLVSTLVKYGNLEDGRDALEAVFEAAKKYVGPDKQEYCDLLIQDWRSFRISYASQQNVSPERPSLTATDKEKAKTNSGTYADDMIQAEELGEEKVSTNKPYAVFLSFNSEDREAVEKIAVHLADHAKLRPWFDQWEQIPGESSMRNLERGLETSSTCAVFVGKSGAGPWQESEVEAALRQQIQSKKFRVIPVLLPDALKEAELPAFLAGNLWVKFQEVLDDKALWLLECGIRGVPPGRGRPKNPKKEQQTAPVSESPNVGQVDVEIAPAEKSVHVFISYRHQEPDNSLAHAFKEVLQKTGHQVFIDTGIRWGADWTKEIREALQKSQFLLLLLSPETAASEMVAEEVAIAKELAQQQNGIPIILPVRVQYPFSEPLPYQLSLWLYTVHQVCWNGVEDTARLVKLLLSTIADRASWPEAVSGQSSPGSVRHITPQPHFDP